MENKLETSRGIGGDTSTGKKQNWCSTNYAGIFDNRTTPRRKISGLVSIEHSANHQIDNDISTGRQRRSTRARKQYEKWNAVFF